VEGGIGVAEALVDKALVEDRADHELDVPGVQEVLDVAPVAGAQVVEHEHLVAARGDRFHQVGADEPGAPSDEVPHDSVWIKVESIAQSTRDERKRRAQS